MPSLVQEQTSYNQIAAFVSYLSNYGYALINATPVQINEANSIYSTYVDADSDELDHIGIIMAYAQVRNLKVQDENGATISFQELFEGYSADYRNEYVQEYIAHVSQQLGIAVQDAEEDPC